MRRGGTYCHPHHERAGAVVLRGMERGQGTQGNATLGSAIDPPLATWPGPSEPSLARTPPRPPAAAVPTPFLSQNQIESSPSGVHEIL